MRRPGWEAGEREGVSGALAFSAALADTSAMVWTEPYLETCCRSALHRLLLCEGIGRPPGLKDGPCLVRLTAMALARPRPDLRFEITPEGLARHDREIARPPNYRGAPRAA